MKKPVSIVVLMAVVGGFVLSLQSCNKDPKVNPCAILHATSADFTIMEDYSYLPDENKYWPYYACDTVATSHVRFTAIDSTADSYEWHIGAGIYTTRSVTLYFPDPSVTSASAILIIHKTPNLTCFPKDNGVDIVTRTVRFVNKCQSLLNGKYFGHTADAPKDTLTITVKVCVNAANGTLGTRVVNPALGCNAIYYMDSNLLGYKASALPVFRTGTPILEIEQFG